MIMKKQLLLYVFLVAFFSVAQTYAQVGIGTPQPNPSAQLEIVSSDRGILIPRVALTSTTDNTTIANGNVNSLLIFNTATAGDVTPGYYYWYDSQWQRLITIGDETVTTLIEDINNEGVFYYINEVGDTATIDVPAEVVTNIQNEGAIYNEILNLIDTNEKVTVLQDNGGGSYTYFSEADIDDTGVVIGTGVTFNVVEDVVTNIQNEGDVYTVIDSVINAKSDTLFYNNDGTYTHIAVDGATTIIDSTDADFAIYDNSTSGLTSTDVQGAIDEILDSISSGSGVSLVDNNNGTVTLKSSDGTGLGTVSKGDLTKNPDGTYTYDNGDGTPVDIDVISDVVTNIQNGGDVYTVIDSVINAKSDTLFYNNDGTYTHIAVDGTTTIIDSTDADFAIYDNSTSGLDVTNVQEAIDSLVNRTNTLSTMSDTLYSDTNGIYTHVTVDGDIVTIDIPADVVTNISNQGDIYQEIINQLDSVYGNVYYNSSEKKFYYIDDAGVKQPIDWSEFNTVNTSFVIQNDSLTVIDSDGNNVQLAVSEIAKNPTFIDSLVTNNRFNDSIVSIIQGNETITTLVQNPDSTYTYTSEDGTTTDFKTAQVGDGIPSQPGNPGDIYVDKSTGDIYTYNTTTNSWELTAGGTDSLANNNDGTYTHISVAGDTTIIDIPADVVTNISNQGDIYQEIINQLDSVYGNVYYNSSEKKFYYIDDAGVKKPIDWSEFNTVNTSFVIQNDSLTVIDSDGNNVQLAVSEIAKNPTFIDSLVTNNRFNDSIVSIIQGNETITTLVQNPDSTYTYTSEDGTTTSFKTAQVGDGIPSQPGNPGDIYVDKSTGDIYTYNTVTNSWELTAGGTDILKDNNDGTYTHTAVDGTVTEIDSTLAELSIYDNTKSGLVADDVQTAIDSLVSKTATYSGQLIIVETTTTDIQTTPSAVTTGVTLANAPTDVVSITLYQNGKVITDAVTDIVVSGTQVTFNIGIGDFYKVLPVGTYDVVVTYTTP